MSHLLINGKKEKIPPFPHHKEHVYRCYKFFRPKSFFTYLSLGRFIAVRETLQGYKQKCGIPRELLVDPTSSCNLKCKGCWAADYGKGDQLSFEKLDDIASQAEKLGIMDILMTGGEPLMRKADIIKLCRKHRKISFAAFTNATLIDDAFADQIAEVGNLNMYVSIEGSKEETDFRRGEGVYEKALAAMERLQKRNIGFAFSACYHAKNYQTIASDAFLDEMRRRGCWLGWLFLYVPVGKDADLSLVCTPEQRAFVKDKISAYCNRHDYTIIDFWNTGHSAYGCVAAGNGFIHINARGDVEPCAFCHYSDANIHDMTLVDALRSPFLTAFRAGQPFSDNPLRPCPMIDVPESIVKIVSQTGAQSTHFSQPESAEMLVEKTKSNAAKWQQLADELVHTTDKRRLSIHRSFVKYLKIKRKISDGRRVK